MPYHQLLSYLALIIIVSVVSTEVARFLLHKHFKKFAPQKVIKFTSTRWTRSEEGSLIEKEYSGQHIDYQQERALPCFAEELANLLQFKLFTSSTADMSNICKKYMDSETLYNEGDTEAADHFFMESMDMSSTSATFCNHYKGSLVIKILRVVEPLQPIWISNVMHNSTYRRLKDMSMLCAKVILYYADMAKDILLTYQMWILAGFTLYIKVARWLKPNL